MAFKLTSFGAAEEVTGSKHLVQYKDTNILLDCGMFQGPRKKARLQNESFPFEPTAIDAVVLSHAHIDHCGLLPKLVKEGFEGPIYCTQATADLLVVMLEDSAHIQESDEKYFSRHPSKQPAYPTTALYTADDVKKTLALVQSKHRLDWFNVGDLEVQLIPAGHVLGSAITKVKAGDRSLLYSGDLGRRDMPLLIDRFEDLEADFVLMESTYGGRIHEPVTLSEEKLVAVVKETCERGGKLLIPAFTLERTQELLYHLENALYKDDLSTVPIYVDSPMAIAITKIFQDSRSYYDTEMRKRYKDRVAFDFKNIQYTRTADDSKAIFDDDRPGIIIAGSGMCESGRIRHHIKNYISNPINTLLLVGYMAEGTLGRRFVEGDEVINVLGEEKVVKAQIVKLNTFSGHADEADLLSWVNSVKGAKKVMLVHGEREGQEILKQRIQDTIEDVEINVSGHTIVLDE